MAAELEGRWNGALAPVAELEKAGFKKLRIEAAPLSDKPRRRRLLEMGKGYREGYRVKRRAAVEFERKRVLRKVIERN